MNLTSRVEWAPCSLCAAACGLSLIAMAATAWAEDITITTYYPSPRGAYKQLRVTDNSATPAVTITQTGAGAGLSVTQLGAGLAVRVDDVAGDTSPFVINQFGSVGIGRATPGAAPVYTPGNNIQLDVAGGHIRIASGDGGNAFVDRPFLELDHPGGSAPVDLGGGIAWQRAGARRMELLYSNADDALIIWDAITAAPSGTPRVTFDRTGNVGIGTTAPGNRLEVVGAGADTVDLRVNGRIRTGDAANNGGIWLGSDNTGFVGETGNNIGFWTNGVSWNALQINKASGNVGIGTAGPTERLHVVGNGLISGKLRVQGDAVVDQRLGVGMGVPGPFAASLSVNGPIHSAHNRFYLTGADGVNMCWIMGQGGQEETAVGNAADNIIGWSQNGDIMGRSIRLLGNVTIGGPAYPVGFNNYSDVRFKTAVAPLSGVLGRLDQLHGVSYQVKDDQGVLPPAEAARRHLGLVAQEMQRVYPELVSADRDGILAVDYVKFVPVLLQAVKELKADNDQLRRRLDALEQVVPSDGQRPDAARQTTR